MAKTIKGHSFSEGKMVPMEKVVITVHKNGNRVLFHAKGKSKKGDVVCTAMSEEDAKAFIKSGAAKKGEGWK